MYVTWSFFSFLDSSRFNKSLRTTNPDGKPIFRISTDDESSQAEFVATEIQTVITASMGLINYKDIAVLMRMNFISREFEAVFRHHKIPFTIVNSMAYNYKVAFRLTIPSYRLEAIDFLIVWR